MRKPMAPTVNDCDEMILAAKKVNKTLQIGYRLYWDPFNVRLMNAMQNNEFGTFTGLKSGFSYNHGKLTYKGDWRMDKKMNPGGALFDIGVYVAQSAFYGTQMHPLSVTAQNTTQRLSIFKEIPEHWNWQLEWPNGAKSEHSSSYGKNENFLHINTPKGGIGIEPAFSYQGLAGYTPRGKMNFSQVFQQKKQIDGQCMAILKREANITSGEMGRRDIYLLNAIIEAAETENTIKLGNFYT